MSADYLSFEGQVEAIEWGRSVYTVLILPDHISSALASMGAKRVEGEINDHPINLGLSKADVIPGTFLWTGKSLLDAAGIEPGEPIDVRLRKADATHVDVPEDVTAALIKSAALTAWEALTPGKQRSHLHPITTAKRAETRAKRIAKLVETLT
ncbi:MAG: YdeI/OmpD-associated family protein [Paracoccaceae bacterium]